MQTSLPLMDRSRFRHFTNAASLSTGRASPNCSEDLDSQESVLKWTGRTPQTNSPAENSPASPGSSSTVDSSAKIPKVNLLKAFSCVCKCQSNCDCKGGDRIAKIAEYFFESQKVPQYNKLVLDLFPINLDL